MFVFLQDLKKLIFISIDRKPERHWSMGRLRERVYLLLSLSGQFHYTTGS